MGMFAALTQGSNIVAISNDGVTWSSHTLPVNQNWTDVTWNGSIFCAVASLSTAVATSPDGITWTERTLPLDSGSGAIAWNGSVFCIPSGTTNRTITSPDGITWTSHFTAFLPGGKSIAWNGSIFCFIISGLNKAYTSPDGITWTSRTLPSPSTWQSISWNGSVFCIIQHGGNKAVTSPDGITWTARTLPSSNSWVDLDWNGSVFCAVADESNKAVTSPDGITWTARTLPSFGYWTGIAWNESVFCVVQYGSPVAYTSPDGITWTPQTMPSASPWIAINAVVEAAGPTTNSINGDISIVVTPYGSVRNSIAGTNTVTITPSSVLLKYNHASISGNIPISLIPISVLHNSRHTVVGIVPIISDVASILHNSRHTVIGNVVVDLITSFEILEYHHATIAGNISLVVDPTASLLQFYNIGNILITISPASSMSLTKNGILLETLSCNTTFFTKQINTIFESIILLPTAAGPTITNLLITEYLQEVDNLLSSLSLSITDTIIYSTTLSGIIHQLEYIIESLYLVDNIEIASNLLSTISELISLIDSSSFGIKLSISESIGLQDTLSTLYKLFSTVLDSIILSESNGSTYIHIASLSESLDIDPNVIHKSIFNNSLLDSFIISIPGVTGQDTYLAYAFNPETNSVSTYTNYNFTCSTLFNGKYLLGNSSGLYEYGGTLDDTTLIEARIKTVAYNFGTSNLKQVPDMYIGGVSSDKMIIKVNVDNRASVYYSINNRISNLHTQRIKFGKGLIGRYFQFELITNSTDTDLESIEFYPIVLQRKI